MKMVQLRAHAETMAFGEIWKTLAQLLMFMSKKWRDAIKNVQQNYSGHLLEGDVSKEQSLKMQFWAVTLDLL